MADKFLNFYMDESGARRPDRQVAVFDSRKHDFFGYGGILASDSEEKICRTAYKTFCDKWEINYPLHSVEIRNKAGNFNWLVDDKEKGEVFLKELTNFLIDLPICGLACVIDRPGYDHRYREKYGRRQWLLCKTAFSISVERAAKAAASQKLLLRVYPERCSKKDDSRVRQYYEELKNKGAPFELSTSGKYHPLKTEQWNELLSELKFKAKTSPMTQIADLYLWPICKAGYDSKHRPYVALRDAKRCIEDHLDSAEIEERGTKYSCFDLVKAAQ